MDEGKTDASGLGKMLTGSYIVDKDNDYCKESVLNERGKKLIKNVSNCSDSEVYASRMLEQLPLDYFTKSEMARSLIKWSSYSHIYSSLTPYGYPTCFLPTRSHLVIGTSKGMILIFDFREFLHGILIPQSSTSDADNALRDAVKILKISEDGTHVAGAYESGHVFLWDINITGSNGSDDSKIEPIRAILYVDDYINMTVIGLDFYGNRHTGLIVGVQETGTITYHSGKRNHLWKLVYTNAIVLKVPSNERLLLCNCKAYEDVVFCGILTSKYFAVMKLGEVPKLIYNEPIKATSQQLGLNYSMSWNANISRVAYSVNTNLSCVALEGNNAYELMKVHDYTTSESISSLQWLSRDLVGVLTISHQFLLLDSSNGFKANAIVDLLEQDILRPPSTHFQWYDSKAFLFSTYSFKIGHLMTWSQLVLTSVQKGNYIESLLLLEYFLNEESKLNNILFYENKDTPKKKVLFEPFYNLAMAAVGFLIKSEIASNSKYEELFTLIFRIWGQFTNGRQSSIVANEDLIDKISELLPNEKKSLYYEALALAVVYGKVKRLPAESFKELIQDQATKRHVIRLQEILTSLDVANLDIDLAVRVCNKEGLIDLSIYIWNMIFNDYLTPFIEFLQSIATSNGTKTTAAQNLSIGINDPRMVFKYLECIFGSKQYPLGNRNIPVKSAQIAFEQILSVLFSGTSIRWPLSSTNNFQLYKMDEEPAFPYLTLLLDYNVESCLQMLDHLFESDILNVDESDLDGDSVFSRQYITEILMDYMLNNKNNGNGVAVGTFIARNCPKYPQFIHVSNKYYDSIIDVICNNKIESLKKRSETALEAIISKYTPKDENQFVEMLKKNMFLKALVMFYRISNKFSDMIEIIVGDESASAFTSQETSDILNFVLRNVKESIDKLKIKDAIACHFNQIIQNVDLDEFITICQNFDPALHDSILLNEDEDLKYRYINILFDDTKLLPEERPALLGWYLHESVKRGDEKKLIDLLNKITRPPKDVNNLIEYLIHSTFFESASILYSLLGDKFQQLRTLLSAVECLNKNNINQELIKPHIFKAVSIANSAVVDEKKYWCAILECLIRLFISDNISTVNGGFQLYSMMVNVFVSISEKGYDIDNEDTKRFSKIFENALENQELLLVKSNRFRDGFVEIFNQYNLSENVLKLVLAVVMNYSSESDILYLLSQRRGWSIGSDVCEICGKKLWGIGLAKKDFETWKIRFENESDFYKLSLNHDVVVFKCRHAFHDKCLGNLGQNGEYHCLFCRYKV
ncbi:Golgi CORVET complex core vacuolar protein 8 [Nakaseomyces glabratus]|nr:Golgi CORVET complex core vacuolar protein 8 [Nakaseomyces glabratus]KAH7591781.1 Golgi CORVET complex core vacuolar protein 8 [Nakaseomyces glabratus]KAH7598811.1 Golgi CORVET complex core vacuolar protein 8 [Nakaseomyces glabratus]KAH7609666.1 Golgi CORVET complex core vacuolar protein 8 [Nakaseomyces glabratus]KAH7615374.1 Golgi CORVET complex core vacuolar protein 8 [Nakaseomyces glabratus]